MPTERTCAECGAPLPANAPADRCPKCLLQLCLDDSATEPGSADPQETGFHPASRTIVVPQADIFTEQIGTVIGRYKLLQQIGEGGFGIVFMAQQTEPVQRKVALKIIKAGMDTCEIVARFEAERQALALMDHPNIAQVLDGGSTTTGRPYFVMELVRGIPITSYCDQANFSTRERLDLFIKVCRAVQHAHQKGVIHRDLKPSNVLVTLHDGEAVAKVIDFGVAKALGQKLTPKTVFTRFEQMIGTPAYMSPEQAALSGTDIDTRSDVYSLGVLLYELLTGVTSLDEQTLRQGALEEIRRMIRETDPPKPSMRVATLGERLLEVAKHRQAEPSALNRLLRGDLDWITMKALEKDRQRRYETANGLAMDVERYLKHEPVAARPPSAIYRLRKTVRRHRFAFAAGAAVIFALILGVLISTWQAVRATRAEREQSKLRQQALNALKEADEQRRRAEQNAEESRQRLEQYANAIYGEAWEYAAGQHEPHSPQEALPLIRRALEVSPTNAYYLVGLAEVYARLNREQDAIATYKRAIELNPGEWVGYQQLAWHYVHRPTEPLALEKARSLALKAAEVTQSDINVSYNTLALVYSRLGLRDESMELFQNAILFTPEKVFARNALAWIYLVGPSASRAPEKALPLALLSVDLTYSNIYETLNTLGVVYVQLGEFEKGIATLEKGIRTPGSNGGGVADYFSLALACHRLGQNEKAETYYRMGKIAGESGDGLLPVGTLEDSERFRDEVEEALGKLIAAERTPVPRSAPKNLVPLSSAELQLLEKIKKENASTLAMPRSELLARAGHFVQAALAFSHDVKENPQNSSLKLRLCSLLVETGDLAAYREHCQEALQRFGNTQDPTIARDISQACLIAPLPSDELEQTARLTDFALLRQDVKFVHHARFNKGLAEYRLGHLREANDLMIELLAAWKAHSRWLTTQLFASAQAVLAMVHQRLDEPALAQKDLTEAAETVRALIPTTPDNLGLDWCGTLLAQALLREAQSLVDPSAVTKPR